jgi:hypothetical protein
LIIQVSSSNPISTSLVIKDNLECFNFFGTGGTGVDGDITTFEQFTSCTDCINDLPVTPTATPQPTPQCNTDAIFVSLISAEDAYCNEFTEKLVNHNGSTFANATEIYTNNSCTTLVPAGRYYSDGSNTWYWNGGTKTLIPNPNCP